MYIVLIMSMLLYRFYAIDLFCIYIYIEDLTRVVISYEIY